MKIKYKTTNKSKEDIKDIFAKNTYVVPSKMKIRRKK